MIAKYRGKLYQLQLSPGTKIVMAGDISLCWLCCCGKRIWAVVLSAEADVYYESIKGCHITYNIPSIYSAEGELDVDKLQKVLNKLIAKHEARRGDARIYPAV